jgi:hypothetical protein
MSGSGLDHRLVRDYLADLDMALTRLPDAQASELREQITAHLDDALPPDATDQAVAATLARLGSPADLVAEAVADAPTGNSATGTALTANAVAANTVTANAVIGSRSRSRRGLRARFAGLDWRRQTALVVGAVMVLATTAYLIVVQTATPLVYDGAAGWWYAQDRALQVDTAADGASQTTVPVRSGQQQGFFVDLYNQSNLTQTVLGPARENGPVDSPGALTATIGVSAPNAIIDNGGSVFTGVKFVLPGVIPPHQLRAVRMLWRSTVCLEGKGSQSGIDELVLRVRVGWIVRIETIPLYEGWFVAGPSHGRCT